MDDGDIMCHPILVPSYLQEFDDANAKIGAERNPQKTEVIYCVDDLGAAPPEWRIVDVQNTAKVSTVTAGRITLGVAVETRQYMADQLFAKADVIRAMRERVHLCQDPQTEFALLYESLGVSRINHILRVHGHTINEPLKFMMRVDSDLLRGSSWVSRKIARYRPHSAQASPESGTRERETLRLRLGALIAAKPHIQAMIQDAATAGLLLQQPLETRLDATATPTYTSTPLMTKTEPRQSCTFRKRPRQLKKRGSKQSGSIMGPASQTRQCQTSSTPTPPRRMKTVRTWTSQHPGKADSVHRSSKRSFHN